MQDSTQTSWNGTQAAPPTGQPAAANPASNPAPQPKKGHARVIGAIIAIIVIALVAYFMIPQLYSPSNGGSASVPQNSGTPSSAPLSSLLAVQNSSANVNVGYTGLLEILNGSLDVPMVLTMYRSGNTSMTTLEINGTSVMNMYKFGSLYYDCGGPVNSNLTCYNATGVVSQLSSSSQQAILPSNPMLVGDMLDPILNATGSTNVTTHQGAFGSLTCTSFSVTSGETTLSMCISDSLQLPLSLNVTHTNSTVSSLYTMELNTSGGKLGGAFTPTLNASQLSSRSMDTQLQWIGALDLLALAQPITASDLTVIPLTGMVGIAGTFNAQTSYQSRCTPLDEFYCSSPRYKYGVLSFTFGQAVGADMSNVTITFVPYGSVYSAADPSFTLLGPFPNGDTIPGVSIQIPPSVAANSTGTLLSGDVYISYTAGGQRKTVEAAALSVYAT